MKTSPLLDFDEILLSNDLWPNLINKIGFFKAKIAVNQALDLQRMQGSESTLPVLIQETCGTALINSQVIKTHIGLSFVEQGMLLIYSNKLRSIQLLMGNSY
tara:strand:- start:536 stop:841 length:306 start_codon:yes stop_codon:yes gene_type:complete